MDGSTPAAVISAEGRGGAVAVVTVAVAVVAYSYCCCNCFDSDSATIMRDAVPVLCIAEDAVA